MKESVTPLNGIFRSCAILVKAERLFTVPKSCFNFPSECIVIHDLFNRKGQVSGEDKKVAIGLALFRFGSYHNKMHGFWAHLTSHNSVGKLKGFIQGRNINWMILPVLKVCPAPIDGLSARLA